MISTIISVQFEYFLNLDIVNYKSSLATSLGVKYSGPQKFFSKHDIPLSNSCKAKSK